MNNETVLLAARNMTIWRGEVLLVDDISVVVERASIVQIQGSNGSGKTTLLRAMIGLADYDEGDILWCGKPMLNVRDELYGQLLYIGHKPGITGGLSPLENLHALCPELGASQEQGEGLRQQVLTVLDELGIGDRIDLPSVALSAGQQRRVALARLRLQQATLWVLDEPLTSLDTQGYEWVKNEIQQHVKQGGAVMFTTHQPLIFDDIPVTTVSLALQH